MPYRKVFYILLAIHFIIVFAFWFRGSANGLFPLEAESFISLGRLFGLLAATFILLQFVLIGRNIWIERTFGLDKLSRVHHTTGKYALIFILIHPFFLTLGYSAQTGVSYLSQSIDFLFNYEDVLKAYLALILFVIIVATSIYIARKRLKYELWYFIHLITYLAVYLSFGHQIANGSDFYLTKAFYYYWVFLYTFVFLNHFVFRFIRPISNYLKYKFYVDKVVKETDNSHSVYIKGNDLFSFPIKSGQFMKLTFLQRGFWWQSHPFSLSNMAGENYIRITPKAIGDFTSQIPKLKHNTKVLIEGPFGIFTDAERKRKKVLLIAGGVGITPIRSLLEEMLIKKLDITLLYSNKYEKDLIFKDELLYLKKKYRYNLHFILSQDKKYKGEKGRIDEEKIKRLVPDYKNREIYLCGPEGFMDSLSKLIISLGFDKKYLHFEKFSLG